MCRLCSIVLGSCVLVVEQSIDLGANVTLLDIRLIDEVLKFIEREVVFGKRLYKSPTRSKFD